MLSVRFLNCFHILSNFCFGWHEIASQAGPIATSRSLSLGFCQVVLTVAKGHHRDWGHKLGQAL